MKFYKNLIDAVLTGLEQIHSQEKYADQVVAKLLKSNKKWGSKDRRLIAELIYNITRYRRLYYSTAEVEVGSEKAELWKVFAAYCFHKGYDLPEWDELKHIQIGTIKENLAQKVNDFVYSESIPDWLNELGEKELGKECWEKEMIAQNQEAEVVLRVNPLAIPTKERKNAVLFTQNELKKDSIETELVENIKNAIQLRKRSNIQHSRAYRNGYVEIQDASSQMVVPFSGAEPNMRIVDACAGAGGKTLHFASAMNNEGAILCLEVVRNKLEELGKRAERAKAEIIIPALPDLSTLNEYEGEADIVLVDAPCSGLGTMRRKSDLKWKITPEFIQQQIELQQQLLILYSSLVKKGGALVYATCSILPSENQNQVKAFLASEKGQAFTLEEDQQILAHQTGYDGFYMARMRKQ